LGFIKDFFGNDWEKLGKPKQKNVMDSGREFLNKNNLWEDTEENRKKLVDYIKTL